VTTRQGRTPSAERSVAPGEARGAQSGRHCDPRSPATRDAVLLVAKLPQSISAGTTDCATPRPSVYVLMVVRGGTAHRDTNATCERRNTGLLRERAPSRSLDRGRQGVLRALALRERGAARQARGHRR
jgi:hypothetical protein